MRKLTDIERIALTEKDGAFKGVAIATHQGGRQFVILAADEAAILEAWYRLGAVTPPDFSEVRPAAIISEELLETLRAHLTTNTSS